jgi:hypothetical protein
MAVMPVKIRSFQIVINQRLIDQIMRSTVESWPPRRLNIWLCFGQMHYRVPLNSIIELVTIKPEVLKPGRYVVETAVSEEVAATFVEWLQLRRTDDFPDDQPAVFLRLVKEFWLADLASHCRVQLGAGTAEPIVAEVSPGFLPGVGQSFTAVFARLERLEAALAGSPISPAPPRPGFTVADLSSGFRDAVERSFDDAYARLDRLHAALASSQVSPSSSETRLSTFFYCSFAVCVTLGVTAARVRDEETVPATSRGRHSNSV